MAFSRPFDAIYPECYYHDPRDGIEFMSEPGKPVHAMADGIVIRSCWDNPKDPNEGMGLRIIQLVSFPGYDSWNLTYGHLADLKAYIGQKIKRGDKIALSGPVTTITLMDTKKQYRKISFERV